MITRDELERTGKDTITVHFSLLYYTEIACIGWKIMSPVQQLQSDHPINSTQAYIQYIKFKQSHSLIGKST